VRIAVATVQVPFIRGGADAHAEGLRDALRQEGHEVEIVTQPFRFSPQEAVLRNMANWESEDFSDLNGYNPEVAICLRFPAYYLRHDRKVIWLMHQHREVYDLWTSRNGDQTSEAAAYRQRIMAQDCLHLRQAARLRTNSQNVSNRLKRFNDIEAAPLYHPPPLAGRLYNRPPEPYIFFPSRLETLKRQQLLIDSMQHVSSGVCALIAGDGGQRSTLERMIDEANLGDRVRLLGKVPDEELPTFYACSLAVFFGPRDEDYGYVTLEAMLSAKPVITCTDSGGPLEFVLDGETGYVTEPEPRAVADAIDQLASDRKGAIEMGAAGRERYLAMGISWENVVGELL
jgi:glycosyltransferase involved in cell wall biosynthesis